MSPSSLQQNQKTKAVATKVPLPSLLQERGNIKRWQQLCCHCLLCYNKMKREEGDDSLVVIAFFAATKPKQKAMAALLLSPYSLQLKKKTRQSCCCFPRYNQKKKKATTALLLSPFSLQQKKNKTIVAFFAATKPKQKGLREGAYLQAHALALASSSRLGPASKSCLGPASSSYLGPTSSFCLGHALSWFPLQPLMNSGNGMSQNQVR